MINLCNKEVQVKAPTQSQNPNTLAESIPNALVLSWAMHFPMANNGLPCSRLRLPLVSVFVCVFVSVSLFVQAMRFLASTKDFECTGSAVYFSNAHVPDQQFIRSLTGDTWQLEDWKMSSSPRQESSAVEHAMTCLAMACIDFTATGQANSNQELLLKRRRLLCSLKVSTLQCFPYSNSFSRRKLPYNT